MHSEGTFEFKLTSRMPSHALESLVAEMYLGEGAGGVKCVPTRADGGGNAGRRGIPEIGSSGSATGSWAFDAKKMVGAWFLLLLRFFPVLQTHLRQVVRWEIPVVPPSSVWLLRGSFTSSLVFSVTGSTLDLNFSARNSVARPAHALQVRFAISSYTFSALKVDQLKVTGEVYKPYKGVRGRVTGDVEWRW